MRLSTAISTIAVALTLALPAQILAQAQAQSPNAAPWRVVDEREIAVDGIPLTLSRDGAWIAGVGPDRDGFCVWDTATLEPTCETGEEVPGVLARSIAWSPDSTAVAFSLNAAVTFQDSDVYVFETATRTVENLTEDGMTDIGFGDTDAPPVPIDLFPSWSPDSEHLVFARSVWNGEEGYGTSLMTIPRDGGEPEELLVLAPPQPLAIYTPMFWQDDDSILFGVWKADQDDRQNGLWRTSLSGGLKPVLPGDATADIPTPILTGISADGRTGSIFSTSNQGRFLNEPGKVFFVVDLDDGTWEHAEDVLGMEIAPDADRIVVPPGFAPEGNAVVVMTTSNDEPYTTRIIDPATGAAVEIASMDEPPVFEIAERPIDWASNDTILIPGPRTSLLVTVEPT